MKKQIVHTPHDKLFKTSLQNPEVAREFLELFLPDNIKNQLDFNSIEYCQTTFVDEQLKLSQTDVLFKCTLNHSEAYLYVLAEHESKVDALIAFWLMKYMISIWHYHIQQATESKALPLPMIFPLVFYTGDGEYTAKRELWQLFGEYSERMKTVFQSPFHLIEAGKIPEEVLTSHVYAGTMGFVLRKYFRKHIRHELQKIIDNLNQLEHEEHHRYVVQLIQYLLNIDEGHKNVGELIAIIHDKMSPNLEKTMSSLAEKLIKEGRLEGKLEGKLEIAQAMLDAGSDIAFILKVTNLPLDAIKKLKKTQ